MPTPDVVLCRPRSVGHARAVRAAATLAFLAALGLLGCSRLPNERFEGERRPVTAAETHLSKLLPGMMEKLRPLQTKLHAAKEGDWRSDYEEKGQTFAEYLKSGPVVLDDTRRVIYVQPIGDFTPSQRRVVALTADYLARYFSTAVKMQEDLSLALIPRSQQRAARGAGVQINSIYVIEMVLKKRLPPDAAVLLALSANDLYPGDEWNFVFGQASLRDRVGVWSLARYGDPDEGPDAFRLCLLRMMKVAAHETGHLFSLKHCILYECNMNGSNHLGEMDAAPLALCCECVAKVCWATRADPVARYRKLAAFCAEQGLTAERDVFERDLRTVEAP